MLGTYEHPFKSTPDNITWTHCSKCNGWHDPSFDCSPVPPVAFISVYDSEMTRIANALERIARALEGIPGEAEDSVLVGGS